MKPNTRPMLFRTNRLFAAATLGTLAPLAQADTITWTNLVVGNATGSWATPGNWSGGVLPTINDTADFSTLDITANSTVSLNGNQSINKLIFDDTALSGSPTPAYNAWTLQAGTPSNSTLTLGGTNASIEVKSNLATLGRDLNISAVIAGSDNWSKTGGGRLRLATVNTFSGDLTIETGILQVRGFATVTPGGSSLGSTVGKTIIKSTGSITTGGQLLLDYNNPVDVGIKYLHENISIEGVGGSAAAITGGGGGNRIEIAGSVTLDGTGNYKLESSGPNAHLMFSGGIARSGANTGILTFNASGFDANPSRISIQSAIDNNGGAVVLNGIATGSLILNASGNDIGDFTVNGQNTTTLKLGISDALATNKNLTLTKGTFDLAGYNQTVNALSGVTLVSFITNSGSADSKLTIGNGGGATFAGVIQDGATHKTALEKTGIGTATLTGANTYAGATTITGGTLAISGAGTIANSPTIIVGASTTFNVSAVTGGYTLGTGQTLSGTGTVSGAMTVAGTLSPGNSPGSITTGNQTWVDGGDYNFQMLDAEGVAGTGFDQIQITGTLNLSSLTAGGFNINLWSLSSIGPDENGNALNFDNTIDQSWTILTTSGGITDFDAADFVINVGANNGTAGFSNALGGGSFSLGTASNNLVLNFTAIPEPGAALLGVLGLLTLLRRRR